MFKVGDRVKLLEESSFYEEIEGYGTITEVDESDEVMPYKVTFDDDDSNEDGYWLFDGEIALVEEEDE